MGIVSGIEEKSLALGFADRQLISRGYQSDSRSFFMDLDYSSSDAGIPVNRTRALNYTAFWACVSLLAGDVASLPLHLYRRKGQRGRERANEHPLYFLLHDEPNPEMDSFSYIESLMYHLVANNGNAYSFIDWDADRLGVKALWPMNPDRVSKERDDRTREIVFKYQTETGGVITLPSYRVWHIPGFGFDGLIGYTPLTYARNQIGLGLAAEKTAAKLFSNGLTIGGILSHPQHLTPEAEKRLRESLSDRHGGVEKAHRLLILEDGLKYEKNNIPPDDAQMLETRKFERNEMATFYHVPPHKIGDLDRATFSNIEEQNIDYVQHTLRRWLVRIERSAKRQLMLPGEKNDYYAEFLVDSLLRGNIESRYRAYAVGRNWGWLTPNRIAEFENLEPIAPEDGGDTYLSPSNMLPADQFNASVPQEGRIPQLPYKL